jgi:septal ring factor EnvC (AmiA/AmiB activator)
MIIFDQIEKLINEHGSSSVLRDHLAFLKEQFALLKEENKVFKSQFEDSQKDNEELRHKIKEHEQVTNNLPKGSRTKRGDFM